MRCRSRWPHVGTIGSGEPGEASEASFRAVNWHNGLMPQWHYLETLSAKGKLPPASLARILGGNAARLLGL